MLIGYGSGKAIVTGTRNLNGQLSQVIEELVARGLSLDQARREFERQFIIASLRSNDGNLSRCAKSLRIHRNTLRNKVSNLRIATREYSPHE